MTDWFAIAMGASFFTLMIPVIYRIGWVRPNLTDFGREHDRYRTAVLLVIIGSFLIEWNCLLILQLLIHS